MGDVVEPTVGLTAAAGSGKPLVRMFLSFAKRAAVVVGRLWELLAEAVEVDRAYQFELWRFDEAILVGEDWDARVRDALAVSELVSVRRTSGHAGLRGLAGKQIYSYQRPFAAVRGPDAQQVWVRLVTGAR